MGDHDPADPRFTRADAAFIRRKADRLLGHYGFTRDELDDVQQELVLHLLRQAHHYRPERGSRRRFVSKVVKHRLLNLVDQRLRKKRNRRCVRPLAATSETQLADGGRSAARVNLHIDVWAVLARVPAALRDVAILLCARHTEREIEAKLGLTRQQVRGRINRLAEAFRRAGLKPDEILKLPNHSPDQNCS